jgi:hypothetical protein
MAGADSVWAWLPAYPPKQRGEYEALLATMVQNKDICPFAVIADGKAKGHMWMMEIRPAQVCSRSGGSPIRPRFSAPARRPRRCI